jgi:hypothetical protein
VRRADPGAALCRRREFEHNGNAAAARALLQQGLRMCKGSQQLWAEYLRMELLYVHKLRARRQVLGLECPDAPPGSQAGGGQQQEEQREEQEAVAEADAEKEATSQAVRAVLTGAVAVVVYKSAVAAIPDSLDFRAALLQVGCARLPPPARVCASPAGRPRQHAASALPHAPPPAVVHLAHA